MNRIVHRHWFGELDESKVLLRIFEGAVQLVGFDLDQLARVLIKVSVAQRDLDLHIVHFPSLFDEATGAGDHVQLVD